MNWKKDHEAKLIEFRRQTRRSAEAFSDEALAFQLSLAKGGIHKEELEAEGAEHRVSGRVAEESREPRIGLLEYRDGFPGLGHRVAGDGGSGERE